MSLLTALYQDGFPYKDAVRVRTISSFVCDLCMVVVVVIVGVVVVVCWWWWFMSEQQTMDQSVASSNLKTAREQSTRKVPNSRSGRTTESYRKDRLYTIYKSAGAQLSCN